MRRVAIIGGGISGLATAYYLQKAGISSTLIERQSHLGGVITTDVVDGCVIEGGPDSFLSAKPWAMDLIQEIGLADEVIGSNDHLRVTYVQRGGRLVPLPDGLMMMVPTKIMPLVTTSLLSWGTKTRMGLELFRRAGEARADDRSVSDFVQDHYGAEAVEYLAEPLLAGVYGGSPSELSVNSVLPRFVELESKYGSLTRGVLAAMRRTASGSRGAPLFRTLKQGLGQLTEALETRISQTTDIIHGDAERVEKTVNGFRVRVGGEELEAENVVLACQAYQAAALCTSLEPELAGLLGSVPYSSSMTVALGYERTGFAHPLNGFGFLVPQAERERLIACTWVGTKFSHRMPDSRVVLRCFLGGARDAAILDESDTSAVSIVRGELRRIMGVTEEPAFSRITRWPRSMAQYTVGHEARVRRMEEKLKLFPGLSVAGNAYYGIGIPDCIRMGKQTAERIASGPPQS